MATKKPRKQWPCVICQRQGRVRVFSSQMALGVHITTMHRGDK